MKPYSPQWEEAVNYLTKNQPIPAQQEVEDWFLTSDSRFIQILGGERAGKSRLAAKLALICMNLEKPSTYWLTGPDYNQARPEFSYLYTWLNDAQPCLIQPGSVSMPNDLASPWTFKTLWGATVTTKTSADVQKLASFSVDGVIMCEAAQQIHEAYLKLMGRVSETRGFLILTGTLERGLPWYADMYKRWQGENHLNARSWSLPSWSNTEVYPGGYDDPQMVELRAEYPEDLFAERFAAQPKRTTGLVLPEFDFATHVKHLTVNPQLPVELWIDPGQHCYAVLFVQCEGLTTHVLDRVYKRNHIAQDIIPEVMGNPLFKYVNPQNAGVIDIAGTQHHANLSQVELWQQIAGCSLRSQYIELEKTINTIRFRLRATNPNHAPLVFFNSHMTNFKTPDGYALDVLAEPELWSWPDRTQNRNLPKNPLDKNNDAMKALGYGLVDRYGGYVEKKIAKRGKRRAYWGVG